MNLVEVAQVHGLTPADVLELRRAMIRTWSAIADDALEGLDPRDDRKLIRDILDEKAGIVAEMTLDADRFRTWGGEALTWVREWSKGGGDLLRLGEAVWTASNI